MQARMLTGCWNAAYRLRTMPLYGRRLRPAGCAAGRSGRNWPPVRSPAPKRSASRPARVGSTSRAAHAGGYRAGGRAPEAHAALGAQAAPQGDVVQQRLAADEAETGQPPVPSVDAPSQARENFRIVLARSRMLPSVRPSMQRRCAAGLYGSSRTGSRSRGRARSTAEPPGCPSPVSPTVAPYVPSAHPYAVRIVVSLRRHGRSSIGAAFDQQGPDDAGHLVGQSNGD